MSVMKAKVSKVGNWYSILRELSNVIPVCIILQLQVWEGNASSNWLVLEGKETQMREVWVDNDLIKLSCLRHYVPLVVVRLGSREGCDSSLRAGLVGKKDKNKVIQIDTEHDPSRKIWRKRRLLILIQQPECCRHSSALFLFHVSTNILLLQETIRVLSFARKQQLRWSWNRLDRF